MKFLALLLFPTLAAYTYSVSMGNTEQTIYIITNFLGAAAWIALGILIHMARTRYSPPVVRAWVYPLAISMKIFCGISAMRNIMNNVVIYFPITQSIQAGVFILNVFALAAAVGYASVYYKQIPRFLERLDASYRTTLEDKQKG